MADESPSLSAELPEATAAFYRKTMAVLNDADLPFIVAGAYAFGRYTGIERHTKDFDLFICEKDVDAAIEAMHKAGFEAEVAFSHWLAKVKQGEDCVDLIFRSGNGVSVVDESWLERATNDTVLGVPALIAAPEEILWTKAFIMERERYDGADVAHLLRGSAERLNWQRLLHLFGSHWRVLLSHLLLFGFIYPSERSRIPDEVMDALLERLKSERDSPTPTSRVCYGTLLSRQQYLDDVEKGGQIDARLMPRGEMTEEEIEEWTEAIKIDGQK